MKRALAGLSLALCACGGAIVEDTHAAADAGSASIGEINGAPFVVRSTSAHYYTNADQPWLAIGLTTQSGTECGPVHGGAAAVELYVFSKGALKPGTYDVINGATGSSFAEAVLHVYGPSCESTGPSAQERGGTITLTSIEPRARGSFDVVTRGVHLTGNFDAPICPNDSGLPSVGMLDACK